MDYLRTEKKPSELLFHDEPMFENVSSGPLFSVLEGAGVMGCISISGIIIRGR